MERLQHRPIAIWVGDRMIIDPECPDCGTLFLVHNGNARTCPCGCVFRTRYLNGRIHIEVLERLTAEVRREMAALRTA